MEKKINLLVLHPRVSSKNAKKALNLFKNGLIKEKVDARFVDFEEVEVFLNNGEVEVLFGEFNLNEVENIFFRKVGFNKDLAFLISTLADRKDINFTDKLSGKFNSGTMGSKSCPSAPSPCSQITQNSGFSLPVSTTKSESLIKRLSR